MDSQLSNNYPGFLIEHSLINKLCFPNDPKEYEFAIQDFGDIRIVENSKCIVHSALHMPSGNKMAVKIIPIPMGVRRGRKVYIEVKLKRILKEIELFQEMSKTANVVDFYGCGLFERNLYICMELMDSSLSDVIRSIHITSKDFSNEFFGFTTISIIEALIECSKVHPEIRPSKILFKRNGEIKLCLFGYSKILYMHNYIVAYTSPEKNRGEASDERSAIWSLGVILLEIILGYLPFMDHGISANNFQKINNWIKKFSWDELEKKEEFKNHFKEDFYRNFFVKIFLKNCLEVNVQLRPNLTQIQELDLYKVFAAKSLDARRSEIASSYNKLEKFYEDLVSDGQMNVIQLSGSRYDFHMNDFEFKSEIWNHVAYLHKPSGQLLALRSYFSEIVRNYDEVVPKMKEEVSFFQEFNSCLYIMNFYGCGMHNLKSFLIFEPMDLSLREFYLYYWLIQDSIANKKGLVFPTQYLGHISVSLINTLSEIHSKGYQMDLNLESTKIFLNIKGHIKIGSSATRKLEKASNNNEKFDLILLHKILMESNKNNYLDLGSIDKDELEITIQEILNNTIMAEDLQENILVCTDLSDTFMPDFINTINKHSLNSLQETIFYKQNMDNFSGNNEYMANAVKALTHFSNSVEIKTIMREFLNEDAQNIALRLNQLKQDFEYEQQILTTPLFSVTTQRLVFPRHHSEYPFNILDFDDEGVVFRTRFSVVNKCVHKLSGFVVAIKSIPIPAAASGNITEDQIKDMKREVQLLKTLTDSPNVTTFYGSFIYDNKLYICMEFMEMSLTNFYQQVHRIKSSFPEELLGCICACITDALIACKNFQIMHRDVKPLNILLNRTGEIKLCDFGVSRILQDSLATTVIGTMAYWPPERFTGEGSFENVSPEKVVFDIRHDVWSLGITLVETALGYYPLSKNGSLDVSFADLRDNTRNWKPNKFDAQLSHYSKDTLEFIQQCLQSVDDRPKYYELTNTNFYKKFSENKAPLDVAKIMQSIGRF